MKKIILLTLLAAFVFSTAWAQKPVKERDLKGVWKLVIDLDEEEIEEDIEDEESALGRVIAKSVTSAVFGVIEEIDIRFEFLPDNRLRIETNVFGVSDVDYADWHINKHGELIIGDTDHFKHDDDDYWLMDGGVLVAYDRHGKRHDGDHHEVYLKPIE